MACSLKRLDHQENPVFTAEVLEQAKAYNGRRVVLRKLVDAGSVASEILDAHTQLMLESRKTMKGMLFEAKWEGKRVYLIGTCHARLIEKEIDLAGATEETASKMLCEIIHPLVLEILQNSSLYVELNMKDPQIAFAMQYLLNRDGLIFDLSLPRQERTPFIEDTAMKAYPCGLDIALIEQQYRNKQPVQSLEAIEDQLERAKAYYSFQKRDPEHVLFSNEYSLECIDAVQWGNMDSMTELDKENTLEMKLVYNKSNQKMGAPVFEKLSSGEKALFAVGTTHLTGEESILSVLKAKGVQIRQIQF